MEVSQSLIILLPKFKIFSYRFGPLMPVTARLTLSTKSGYYLTFMENPIDATYKDLVKYGNGILYKSKVILAQEYNLAVENAEDEVPQEIMTSGIYERVFINRELDPTSELHPAIRPTAIEPRLKK